MTCEELKTKIINKTLDDSFLVFVYKNNKFIVNQYINQICTDKKLTKKYISSLEEISVEANQFFETADNLLYIVSTDKLVCASNMLDNKNTIVVCKEVVNPEACKNNIVEFPVLTKDQVYEYMQVMCPGLPENNIHWLYDITGGDIYRIDLELKKLSSFPENSQESVFKQLVQEDGYADLNSSTIYNCVNAFIYKNTKALDEILKYLDVIDIEGTGLVTILIKNIKNIIDVKSTTNATADRFKMSPKQFEVVVKQCSLFTMNQLVNMFEFLTSIDYRLKSGLLDMDNSQMVGYILTNLMEVGYHE